MVDSGNEDDVAEIMLRNRDSFDNQIALGTQNEAGLGSHYPFSPDRYRLFKNGTRQFVQYNSITELDDTIDSFKLTPQSDGDVVTLQTAERFRYTVNYVLEWSLAMQLNQSLQTDEIVAVGYGDPDLANTTDNKPGPSADGWFVYQNGSNGTNEATISEYRNGTEKDSQTVQLENLMQTWGRIGGRTNWYNVGQTTAEETYTSGGSQFNDELGTVSADNGKGPELGNQKLQASIKAKSGAGNLTLEVGSFGVRTLGDTDGIIRNKQAQIEAQTVGSTDVFVPLAAVRVDPNRTQVSADFATITATNFTGSGNAKIIALAFDPSKTDASGFETLAENSSTSSVIETTTSVSQVADSSGTQTSNPADPGGYQVGFSSIQSTRNTGGSSGGTNLERKSLIANGDEVVICGYVPSAGSTGDMTFEFRIDENW